MTQEPQTDDTSPLYNPNPNLKMWGFPLEWIMFEYKRRVSRVLSITTSWLTKYHDTEVVEGIDHDHWWTIIYWTHEIHSSAKSLATLAEYIQLDMQLIGYSGVCDRFVSLIDALIETAILVDPATLERQREEHRPIEGIITCCPDWMTATFAIEVYRNDIKWLTDCMSTRLFLHVIHTYEAGFTVEDLKRDKSEIMAELDTTKEERDHFKKVAMIRKKAMGTQQHKHRNEMKHNNSFKSSKLQPE